jgi:hypothetical protein
MKNIIVNHKLNKSEDEFLKLNNVAKSIECLHSGGGNMGNALLILNNLINICENIKCKYILAPGGLDDIIKNNIVYKEYNITILPHSYESRLNKSFCLIAFDIYKFRYTNKLHKIRMNLLRNEIISNLPRYNASPHDLYIHIRSGDIFKNNIHSCYAQPPLCFYKKIINENKINYNKIFLISIGHENPIVDILLKMYPQIIFIHGTILEDASVLINIYNLILPVSSFTYSLIRMNNNLRKIYIYDIMVKIQKVFWYTTDYYLESDKLNVYVMKPSLRYEKEMKGKWKNTKEQLNLMINENCLNSSLVLISKKRENI